MNKFLRFPRLRPVLVLVVSLLALTVIWALTNGRPELSAVAAFLFLTTVLLAAFFGSRPAAVVTALAATLAFDFFYLPPAGTLSIASPADWVVLGVFLLTAGLISGLVSASARVQERNGLLEASFRRYQAFSAALLQMEGEDVSLTRIAEVALTAMELDYCSLHVFSRGRWDHYRGVASRDLGTSVEQTLAGHDHRLDVEELSDERDRGVRFFPVRKGERTLVLLAVQSELPAEALNALAYLIGLRVASLPVDR